MLVTGEQLGLQLAPAVVVQPTPPGKTMGRLLVIPPLTVSVMPFVMPVAVQEKPEPLGGTLLHV